MFVAQMIFFDPIFGLMLQEMTLIFYLPTDPITCSCQYSCDVACLNTLVA